MLEERIDVIMEHLQNIIGEYEIPTAKNKEIMKENLSVLNDPQFIEKFKGSQITLKEFEDILAERKLNLKNKEKSYCVYLMYNKTKDLDKLNYEALAEFLKAKSESGYGDDFEPEKEESKNGTNKEGSKFANIKDEYKDDFNSEKEDSKPKSNSENSKKAEDEYQDNFEPEEVPEDNYDDKKNDNEKNDIEEIKVKENDGDEYDDNENNIEENNGEEKLEGDNMEDKEIEINEEQLIEIAQNGFKQISQYIRVHELTLNSLFEGLIVQEKIDGQLTEVISTDAFRLKIQEMNLEGLDEIKQECLIKIISANETEAFIKFSDLEQIISDYNENDENGENIEMEELDYSSLDNVSMILMLALTEYLIKENIPIYDLFNESIYDQPVEGPDGAQTTIEAIDAIGFFKVIQEMGIRTEEDGHENLQKFLAIVPEDLEKLSLNKLKEAIKRFASDEQLREEAHKYYMEFVNEANEDNRENETDPESKPY